MKLFLNFLGRRVIVWLAGVLLAGGVNLAQAQQGIGDIVYTVGTTARDTSGREWAYLLWQSTTPNLLTGRVFAVYAKPGVYSNAAPYVRQSIVRLQTDERLIAPLLARSVNVGQDLTRLQLDMEQIFGALMPSNSIDLGLRLSAVIRGSLNDPSLYQNLILLARNHPGVSLCLGQATAEMIGPGLTTFEIRAYDPGTDKDMAVIGRVTVQAGAPTILPRPGPPVVVPDPSPRGDLNVKLRWGSPDDLRRLSLMQFGFNLFRVTAAQALASNWNVAFPPPWALTNLAVTRPAAVKRVNRVPIIPSKQFSLADAMLVVPPGDTNTMFIADDDGRYKTNYVNYGFTNGARYYYFVTARDVLGRDGYVSAGTLATVCDRMPPFPPDGVTVANDYAYVGGTPEQALRVNWSQVTNFHWIFLTNAGTGHITSNKSETIANYWIYRWSSVTQMNYLAGNMSNHLIAVVPHLPGLLTNGYVDNGSGAPSTPADYGKTWWYTVRAGDAGACGQNLSANSGPVFGVLRLRDALPSPTGGIQINCVKPWVKYTGVSTPILGTPNTNYLMYELICQRRDARVEWAEFYEFDNLNTNGSFLGRKFFTPKDLAIQWYGFDPTGKQGMPIFWCRVGANNGKISTFAISPTMPRAETRQYYFRVIFDAGMQSVSALAGQDRDCPHDPRDPGTGGFTNVVVTLIPPSGSNAKEYRIYRRVDDGPLILTCQGRLTNLFTIIACMDDSPPVNGGKVCYFGQVFDEHGNNSPLALLGCIQTAATVDLPVPVLKPILPLGHTNDPQMNLAWFSPPYGVDRFEVWIGALPADPDTNNYHLSSSLAYSNWPPSTIAVTNKGINTNFNFYIFRTPHVGSGFGGGGAQFVIPASITIGKTYAVFVKAMGPDGSVGKPSNIETFLWAPTNGPIIEVPWPARSLPATNTGYFGLAVYLDPSYSYTPFKSTVAGNAVLVGIGHVASRIVGGEKLRQFQVLGIYNPNDWIGTNAAGTPVFPAALYRYQTINANFPTVSGDMIQVSPLMEQIAYGTNAIPGQTATTTIYDPFITATYLADPAGGNFVYLWLRDTQPQISGATYKYVLMRFNENNREVEQSIPTNEALVP